MYERSTNSREWEKCKKVYAAAKASDSQGIGAKWQWGGDCSQVSDSSPHSVSVEEDLGAKGGDVFEREEAQGRSQDKGIGRREPHIEGSSC